MVLTVSLGLGADASGADAGAGAGGGASLPIIGGCSELLILLMMFESYRLTEDEIEMRAGC